MCLDDKEEKSLYADNSNINIRRRKETMNYGPDVGMIIDDDDDL
jgi:hypothetical protein